MSNDIVSPGSNSFDSHYFGQNLERIAKQQGFPDVTPIIFPVVFTSTNKGSIKYDVYVSESDISPSGMNQILYKPSTREYKVANGAGDAWGEATVDPSIGPNVAELNSDEILAQASADATTKANAAKNRATHTGMQPISSITDLQNQLDALAAP